MTKEEKDERTVNALLSDFAIREAGVGNIKPWNPYGPDQSPEVIVTAKALEIFSAEVSLYALKEANRASPGNRFYMEISFKERRLGDLKRADERSMLNILRPRWIALAGSMFNAFQIKKSIMAENKRKDPNIANLHPITRTASLDFSGPPPPPPPKPPQTAAMVEMLRLMERQGDSTAAGRRLIAAREAAAKGLSEQATEKLLKDLAEKERLAATAILVARDGAARLDDALRQQRESTLKPNSFGLAARVRTPAPVRTPVKPANPPIFRGEKK